VEGRDRSPNHRTLSSNRRLFGTTAKSIVDQR
jgi:hypothetical protein